MEPKDQGQEPTEQEPKQDKPTEPEKVEVFPRDYVEDLRSENKNWRQKVRALEEQVSKLETSQRAKEETELADQQKWQQVAEKRDQRIKELEASLKAKETQVVRIKVAAEFGLNVSLDDETGETLADRLRGETEDELRRDAARLAKLFKPAQVQAEELPAAKPEPEPEPQPEPEQPRRQTTTAVPGGKPIGKTDEDRRREYKTRFTDSPMFNPNPDGVIYNTPIDRNE